MKLVSCISAVSRSSVGAFHESEPSEARASSPADSEGVKAFFALRGAHVNMKSATIRMAIMLSGNKSIRNGIVLINFKLDAAHSGPPARAAMMTLLQ